MSVESFRELCNKWKHYHFVSEEDFENKKDYEWTDVNKIQFKRWLENNISWIPTNYYAYWVKEILDAKNK